MYHHRVASEVIVPCLTLMASTLAIHDLHPFHPSAFFREEFRSISIDLDHKIRRRLLRSERTIELLFRTLSFYLTFLSFLFGTPFLTSKEAQ
jgi:hypothetical protein